MKGPSTFFLTALLLSVLLFNNTAQAQCNALTPSVTIVFDTDQACAPVTVTQFEVTYNFLSAQTPADIVIRYVWNDPGNNVTNINLGNGLVVSNGNRTFSANATFTYVDNNNQCNIRPTAYIIVGGVICTSSEQLQTAFFWGTDEQANANLSVAPPTWDVCFNNPVVNATFTDNSEFNCNINVEQDTPNRLERHVQFVYGTNHNPASTIRNLTLTDGGPVALTNATGNLASTSTRGIALPVTAAYFGAIDAILFPADGPVSVSLPVSAPADIANLVGNRFEVTMFNWNICNPWNGSVANPNYEDAIFTRAYIQIVDAPSPSFITVDNLGNPKTNFCINETIFTDNQTPGAGFNYLWEFFDDVAGTSLVATRTQREPTFSYATGGTKLIRLTVSNPTAQGSCSAVVEHIITIAPTLVANILVTDVSNNPITPDFCQESQPPLTTFQVRFTDASIGTADANTRWRWEFYDAANTLIRQEPTGGGVSAIPLGPFDESYTTKGVYRVKLYVRDNISTCQTEDEVQVRVFEKPVPDFTVNTVCEGGVTNFTDASTINSVAGGTIASREWDLNYNGVTFIPDASLNNQTTFSRTLAAGTRQVALRTISNQGCENIIIKSVVVHPLPIAAFNPNRLSGCSDLGVDFQNQSVVGQPDIIDRFIWEIDDGSGAGFVQDSVQRPTDASFSSIFTRTFVNNTLVDKIFAVRLRVITVNNCERLSAAQLITVNPSPRSGFVALNYSPFNPNCSPVTVNFQADAETQSLAPSDYRWIVRDGATVLQDVSTGTSPVYSFAFSNTTQLNKDFTITLLATLPAGGCFGDSTQTIRISPVPVSDFTLDTLVFNCERFRIRTQATQVGMPSYRWTVLVGGVPVFEQQSDASFFEYELPRVIGVDQPVEIRLVTGNFATCNSLASSKSYEVPRYENINTSFGVTPLVQTLPSATVQITNTTNPGPWTYLWDFGDNTSSIDPGILQHTYATYGTYTITLTVTNGVCVEVFSRQVIINPIPPVVDFSYDPGSGCAPLKVTFTNLSQYAEGDTYEWDFGDGEKAFGIENPVHIYREPGIYSVTLRASNILGQQVTESKSGIIEVFKVAFAQFQLKPAVLYIPGNKLFTDNNSRDATIFFWDFGDGSTSDSFEPTYEYKEEGVYDVTLVANNADGCADTFKMSSAVNVLKSGELMVPNAFSPDLSGPGGSGQNDRFIPLLRGVKQFTMWVFNRWGELLYETSDPERGWDGYYKGVLCQQDVYVYKIKATFEDGRELVKMGDIHLMR
jgi:gliding motility-associated-like protein